MKSIKTGEVYNEIEFTGLKKIDQTYNRVEFIKCRFSNCDFSNAINYCFDPTNNTLTDAKFSCPDVLNLVEIYGIKVVTNDEDCP